MLNRPGISASLGMDTKQFDAKAKSTTKRLKRMAVDAKAAFKVAGVAMAAAFSIAAKSSLEAAKEIRDFANMWLLAVGR